MEKKLVRINYLIVLTLVLPYFLGAPLKVSAAEVEEVNPIPQVIGTGLKESRDFIDTIAPEAQKLAQENDLYASVMIAQAILSTNYGKDDLADPEINNLFTIKGRYNGQYVKRMRMDLSTADQDIYSEFRKYPSVKESLLDYVSLLKEGNNYDATFYKGAWKSQTKDYKEATKFLATRYAETSDYGDRLDELIERYDLTRYDDSSPVAKEVDKKVTGKKDKESKSEEKTVSTDNELEKKAVEGDTHQVVMGESLLDIAEDYNVPVKELMLYNNLTSSHLSPLRELKIPNKK